MQIPRRIHTKNTPKHITFKLWKTKEKYRKSNQQGKKRHLTFNRTTTAGLWNTRKQQNDLKELRENNCSPRSYGQQKYPLISEGKVKTFSDRQKQKNY